MLKILFRGKSIKTGKWLYGNYAMTDDPRERHWIFQNGATEENEVLASTVSQYTGTDDKAGIRIFGGDILKFVFEDGSESFYKVYEADGAWMMQCPGCIPDRLWADGAEMEIIGNIWDNPELLGAGYVEED